MEISRRNPERGRRGGQANGTNGDFFLPLGCVLRRVIDAIAPAPLGCIHHLILFLRIPFHSLPKKEVPQGKALPKSPTAWGFPGGLLLQSLEASLQ